MLLDQGIALGVIVGEFVELGLQTFLQERVDGSSESAATVM